MPNLHRDFQRTLAFFDIEHDDIDRFSRIATAMERLAPPALDRLYDKIAATPETAGFFATRTAMRHARDKQVEHWVGMFRGGADSAWLESAQRIGRVHSVIGLDPAWYVGGYASVLGEVIVEMMGGLRGAINKGAARTVASLIKMALLDMQVALSTYAEAEEAARISVVGNVGDALSHMTQGDFTRPLEALPAGFEAIAKDLETMRGNVRNALAGVADAARNVDVSAREVRQASDDLAHRTERQAASLEEASASLTALTSTVRATADDAAHMHQSVQDAHGDAQAGGRVLGEAVHAMNDIHNSAQEIGKIIAVIDGIAFQTNLLALNAGVEAARAGDAGRGFAVVANEVRALAQRSAEAALDIKKLIGASAVQVERGVELVGQTGDTFTRIVGKVGEIAGLASTIADVAREQAANLDQIQSTVRELDMMTQQNAAMVEEANAASRSLAGEADRMSELAGRFVVDVTDRRAHIRNAA